MFRRRRHRLLAERLWTTAVGGRRRPPSPEVVDGDRGDDVGGPEGMGTTACVAEAAATTNGSSNVGSRRLPQLQHTVETSRFNEEAEKEDMDKWTPPYDAAKRCGRINECDETTPVCKAEAMDLFDRLDVDQLSSLLEAIEAGTDEQNGCVPVRRRSTLPRRRLRGRSPSTAASDGEEEEPREGDGIVSAVPDEAVLCCRLWRWPDLVSGNRDEERPVIRPMPYCVCGSAADDDAEVVCCNPFHWSRLLLSTTGSCCLRETDVDNVPVSESDVSVTGSSHCAYDNRSCHSDCDCTSMCDGGGRRWCVVSCWEMTRRVGPQFVGRDRYINVFQRLTRGSGLCLELLQQQQQQSSSTSASSSTPCSLPSASTVGRRVAARTPESIRRTRDKIGPGLTLSLESDGVWIYNRSDLFPVFVTSGGGVVRRLGPGFSMCAVDRPPLATAELPAAASNGSGGDHQRQRRRHHRPNACVVPLQISFVKGWGPGYRRPYVTGCPCWIEVLVDLCVVADNRNR
jgi:MAD (mothers against decapentaplegic) family protein 6/7